MPAASAESRFKVLHRLASGGMADVYLALLQGPHGFEKQTIVKRIRAEFAGNDEYRRMFIDEARLMASLSHANVVSVLDFGEGGDGIFIALEHVDGLDLRRLLQRTGTLEPAMAIYIGACVLHGLAYLHTHRARDGQPLNIVHRDVSPSNVFLGRNGDVKLGDFGVAKAARGAAQTAPGLIKGKLAYMSPEQAGAQEIDGRSDLFSMGVVLYELLTGSLPLSANSDLEMLKQLTSDDARPIEIPPSVPPALAAFLKRALARDRAERFQTADEMAKALLGCAAGPPLGPSDVAQRVQANVQPLDLAPAADPFAQALGHAGDETTVERAAPTMPARPGRKPRSKLPIPVAVALVLVVAGGLLAGRLRTAATQTDAAVRAPLPSPRPAAAAPSPAAPSPGEAAGARGPEAGAAATEIAPGKPSPAAPELARATRPAAGADPAPRRPAHARAARAQLVVNSTPWAKVYVDGTLVGDTPTSDLNVESGRHTLRLVNPQSGKSFETTVVLSAGEHRMLPVDLEAGVLTSAP